MVCGRQQTQDLLRAFDANVGNGEFWRFGFTDDGGGAGGDGVRDKGVAVV